MRRFLVFLFALILIFPASLHSAVEASASIPPGPALRLIRSDGVGVTLNLTVSDYQPVAALLSDRTDRRLNLAGYQFTNEAGKPQVPVVTTLIGIPADANLELRVLTDDARSLPGSYFVIPAPAPVRLQDLGQDESQVNGQKEAQAGGWEYWTDESVYSADASYPPSLVSLSADAWVRDQHVVRVNFYPFQYNPARANLIWHRELRIEILFHSSEALENQSFQQNPRAGEPDPYGDVLKGMLINYAVARSWRGALPASVEQSAPDLPQAGGTRYKITVDHDGLYRLTYNDLITAGVDLSHLDPRNFSLSSQGEPVAMKITGAADGKFDLSDELIFYGQRFYGDRLAARYASEADNWINYTQQLTDGQHVPWHPTVQAATMEKYTDKNVYWLEVNGPGLNIGAVDGNPAGSPAPVPVFFNQTVHAESSIVHWEYSFTSQEEWYWEWVRDTQTHLYTTTLTALSSLPYSATLRAEVVAFNNNDSFSPDHHAKFFINSGSTPLADVKWDGISRYPMQVQVSQSSLIEGVNTLKFTPLRDGGAAQPQPSYMFDWFDITYARQFQALNNTLTFTGDISGTWKYQVGGFTTPDISVFDITQPLTPTQVISASVTGAGPTYTLKFVSSHPAGEKFIASTTTAYQTPVSIQAYQDHLAFETQGADYVMITPPELITATQALADYRQSQGLHTMVVDVKEIYNEFNDGIYHPFAIKQFLKYANANWQIKPVYVVLVGDGNWNVKGYAPYKFGTDPIYMPPNLAWVDPWQGEVDSANLLANIVGTDPLPDVLISRMPVQNAAELYAILDKISTYENSPVQNWQRNLLFIADNADAAGDFPASLDGLIHDYVRNGFQPYRGYLDDYLNSGQCLAGGLCAPATRAITETMSITGALFVTYSGHGAIGQWAGEKLVVTNTIPSINNGSRLPVVFSLDCLDGFWIHPITKPSLAEKFLTSASRGAVSVFSPTGLGLATGHDTLADGFYSSIFDNGNWELGPASLSAKLAVYATSYNFDLIDTYTIFGDPALKIRSPYQADITPSQSAASSPAGTNISYLFDVHNLGAITDTFDLTVTGSAWPVGLPHMVGPLPAGGSQDITVTVSIPPGTPIGTWETARLRLSSTGDISKVVTSTLETSVTSSTVVSLSAFNAVGRSTQIELTWDTTTEINNQGFYVRRSLSPTDPASASRIMVYLPTSETPIGFIPSTGDALSPAHYEVLDKNVQVNTTYYYWLEMIDSGSSSTFIGSRQARLITWEFLPQIRK